MGWEDNEDLMGPPWNWGSPAAEGQQLCAGAVNCRAGGLGLSTACAQTNFPGASAPESSWPC